MYTNYLDCTVKLIFAKQPDCAKLRFLRKTKIRIKRQLFTCIEFLFICLFFFLSYSGKTHFYTAPIVIVRLSREKKMYFFIWYGA